MGIKLIKTANYDELSRKAADIILAQIENCPESVLGLATGSTPVGTYALLAKAYNEGKASFKDVKTINLDEYIGLGEKDQQSYRYFMNENLFSKVDILKENTYVPNGLAGDIAAECSRYDGLLQELGGADIQLLGIGINGHVGFNEPAAALIAPTHAVTLTQSTLNANAKYFPTPDDMPKQAITLGMAGILSAKRILLLASGSAKKEAIQKTLYGNIDPTVPASFLQLHNDVVVICDFDV